MESTVKNALPNTIESQFDNSSVCIHIHSVRNRPTDADNVSAKAAIDGIVKAGILRDDNFEIVKSVTHSQSKGKTERTFITISEVSNYG